MFGLQPLRHISTLRNPVVAARSGEGPFTNPLRTLARQGLQLLAAADVASPAAEELGRPGFHRAIVDTISGVRRAPRLNLWIIP